MSTKWPSAPERVRIVRFGSLVRDGLNEVRVALKSRPKRAAETAEATHEPAHCASIGLGGGKCS